MGNIINNIQTLLKNEPTSYQTKIEDYNLYNKADILICKYVTDITLKRFKSKEKFLKFLIETVENSMLFWEDVDYCRYFRMSEESMDLLLNDYITKILHKKGLMICVDRHYKI